MGWNNGSLKELRAALDTLMAKGKLANTPEYYLLRIYFAEIQMYGEGKFRAALEEARVIEKWLEGVPVEDYADVMVYCVWKYYTIVQLCRTTTNWLDDTNDGNLPPTEAKTAAASMTLLRRTLQQQGRLVEAQQLVKDEAGLQKLQESLFPFTEILNATYTPETQRHEVFRIKAAFLRLLFADQLAHAGEKSKVASTLPGVEETMKKNFGRNWERHAPRLKILIDRIILTSSSTEPSKDTVQRHLELGARAEGLRDFQTLRVCLMGAYLDASKLADRAQSPFLKASTKRLEQEMLAKYFSFEAEQAQSALFLA